MGTDKKGLRKPIVGGVAQAPVVMQMDPQESGAACLAMILAYYDRWISLAQARQDCGISRDGSKAENILRAAKSYGLETQSARLTAAELREKGSFPCIVGWGTEHFVVLNGFQGGKVLVNDPEGGALRLTAERFEEFYRGDCLQFAPGDGFQTGGKQISMFAYAKKRLAGSYGALAFVVVTTFIISLVEIIQPAFERVLTDRLLEGGSPQWAISFS